MEKTMQSGDIEFSINKLMEEAWELGLEIPIIRTSPIGIHEIMAQGNVRFMDSGPLNPAIHIYETPYGRVQLESSRSAPAPALKEITEEDRDILKEYLNS